MPTIRTVNDRSRSLRVAGGMTNKRTGNDNGKGEYRGLSAAAAKCAAFGRDDVSFRRCEKRAGSVERTDL
jgi:hypothetical protein